MGGWSSLARQLQMSAGGWGGADNPTPRAHCRADSRASVTQKDSREHGVRVAKARNTTGDEDKDMGLAIAPGNSLSETFLTNSTQTLLETPDPGQDGPISRYKAECGQSSTAGEEGRRSK